MSSKTHKAYEQKQETLNQFLQALGYPSERKLTDGILAEFIAWLSLQGKAPATIALYLAGVSFRQKRKFGEDLTNHPTVKQLMTGVRRGSTKVDDRQPITGKFWAL